MWPWLLLALLGTYICHRAGVIELDFPLRRFLRIRRGRAPSAAQDKQGLFVPDAQEHVARLEAHYALGDWSSVSSRDAYAASMFYLALVEDTFAKADLVLPERLKAVDVGVNDWFYVRPLYAFLADSGRTVELDGIEIDAYRICPDRYTTIDHAERYIQTLPNCHYHAQDALTYHAPVDVAFMFFPFIFRDDHKRWGLPRKQLAPAQLLAHVHGLLKPGGFLFIVNQGEAEHQEQGRLLDAHGIPIIYQGGFDSPIYDFEMQRYVTVARQA